MKIKIPEALVLVKDSRKAIESLRKAAAVARARKYYDIERSSLALLVSFQTILNQIESQLEEINEN